MLVVVVFAARTTGTPLDELVRHVGQDMVCVDEEFDMLIGEVAPIVCELELTELITICGAGNVWFAIMPVNVLRDNPFIDILAVADEHVNNPVELLKADMN